MTEYVKTLDELAERLDITDRTLNNWKSQGFRMPPKTSKGYNLDRFKKSVADFEELRKGNTEPLTLRDQKTAKEIEKLVVNIDIDGERLKQQEIETRRIQGHLMERTEHNAICDAYMHLYLSSLDQLIEDVSTKLRDAKAREILQKSVDNIRNRIAERGN